MQIEVITDETDGTELNELIKEIQRQQKRKRNIYVINDTITKGKVE